MQRRRLLAAMVTSMLLLVGACGGDGDNESTTADTPNEEATTTTEEDEADDEAAAADFECPVEVEDVESLYEPIAFDEPTIQEESCTFPREDKIGSVNITVMADGGRTAYNSFVQMAQGKPVEDLGDEAAYGEGLTALVIRKGDTVVHIQNVSMLGVGGSRDSDAQLAAVRQASIALGGKVLAEL